MAISFAYKLLLQLLAVYMAFHTRKVKIKALNDSKQIGILVYVNSFVVVGLGVIAFGFRNLLFMYMIAFGAALFITATVFLSVVFVPRVRSMHSLHDHRILSIQGSTHIGMPIINFTCTCGIELVVVIWQLANLLIYIYMPKSYKLWLFIIIEALGIFDSSLVGIDFRLRVYRGS